MNIAKSKIFHARINLGQRQILKTEKAYHHTIYSSTNRNHKFFLTNFCVGIKENHLVI